MVTVAWRDEDGDEAVFTLERHDLNINEIVDIVLVSTCLIAIELGNFCVASVYMALGRCELQGG